MSLKKSKGTKKDKLEGAINEELTESIMSDFIHNVKNDKTHENFSSKESREDKENMKDEISLPANQTRSLPMIRNSSFKEWWISLTAFATIVTIVLILIFLPWGGKKHYELLLSPHPIDTSVNPPEQGKEVQTFNSGEPVYVYFVSPKPFNVKKIFIHVISLNAPSMNTKMSSMESNINPKWKSIETHFQKEYFETPGEYKITIENQKHKVLAERVFSIQ